MERATSAENRIPKFLPNHWQQGNPAQLILPFVLFGALWSMLIAGLSPHWIANPQYSFGWFVPILCGYLFLIRWRSRPPAELAKAPAGRWIFWIAGCALAPTWLVEQANQIGG